MTKLEIKKYNIEYTKNQERKNFLESIGNYYIDKYNLKVDIDISLLGFACHYKIDRGYIEFSIEFVLQYVKDNIDLIKRTKRKNINNNLLFAFLHEIKHIIDRNILKDELKTVNFGLYKEDSQYHHNLPFELRADKFARREVKKWLYYGKKRRGIII